MQSIITAVYSRDLRYKEMMMESMIKLPDDMFRQEILQYLTVDNIVKLDNACMNHKYRLQVLDKMSGVILLGDQDQSIKASLYKWLGMRRIYLIKMKFIVSSDFYLHPSSIENDYVDQFRYTQHVVLKRSIVDDMAIFIISHCPCLLSIGISGIEYDFSSLYPQVTDHTLQTIAEHCTGLQSLSLSDCREITDTGLIAISKRCHKLENLKVDCCDRIQDASIISISIHCIGLQSLNLVECRLISDASIISISNYCTGLQSLNLEGCHQITDASIISVSIHCIGLQSLNLVECRLISDISIISISNYCTGLQSLNLEGCHQITDASIISISTHCTVLQSLNLGSCHQITDVSIISISIHCTGVQSLRLWFCHQITDASIISISENCTGLNELNVSYTTITDASLIAIAKNCNALQSLCTYKCNRISCNKLRAEFNSVSELQAALLSIYSTLPI